MQFAAVPVVLAALATVAGALWMQQDPPKRFAYPPFPSPEEAMSRWMKVCKPGPAHERLKELIGSYETTMRMGMGGDSKGSAEITWLAEGRWLQIRWTGAMMGQKTTGTTILGYDNFKERFVSVSVDTFQTCMNTASGLFDQKGDHLTLWGTIDEPGTPEQDKQVKYVYRDYGTDRFTFEVHDMMIGETNTKVMEIVFSRKK
jgi:hypothetical protein